MIDTDIDDDPLRVYLREVNAVPPLAPEEEAQLLRIIEAKAPDADRAKTQLLEANLRLVVGIVPQ